MTGTYTPDGLTSERDQRSIDWQAFCDRREHVGEAYAIAPNIPDELRKLAYEYQKRAELLRESARQIEQAEHERFVARTK